MIRGILILGITIFFYLALYYKEKYELMDYKFKILSNYINKYCQDTENSIQKILNKGEIKK